MSYSMLGFGAAETCEGSAGAGAEYTRLEGEAKSACTKASNLRKRMNELRSIVKDQTPLIGSGEITAEKVELFQAERDYPNANSACEDSIARKSAALKRFIAFQAAGCYAAGGAAPVRTGTTTVEHVGRDKVVVLPEVTIEADKPPKAKAKGTGGGYSAAMCPPGPARTRQGQRGQAVFCWQRFLQGQGFSLSADGDHGEITERASKDYESRQAPAPVVEPVKPVVEPVKPVVEPVKPKTASVLPDTILGLPTNVALAGAAALLIGGAVFYMKSQQEGAES